MIEKQKSISYLKLVKYSLFEKKNNMLKLQKIYNEECMDVTYANNTF